MIADAEIRSADPAAVVEQYEPYLQKIANKYINILQITGAVDMDDLLQAGRIAIIEAIKQYNPDRGSFINLLFYYVRTAMRRELGFDVNTGALPAALVYLDEPLSDGSKATLGDTLTDPGAVTLDESIIQSESRSETSEQIRAALGRMKHKKQRAAVSLVWLEEKSKQSAADELGVNLKYFYELERAGRSTLRRDARLRKYAYDVPFVHIGVKRYNTTWTSATEYAVLWRLEHLPQEPQNKAQNEPQQEPQKEPQKEKQRAEKHTNNQSKADMIRALWNQEHR